MIIVKDIFTDVNATKLIDHIPTKGGSWITSGTSSPSPDNFVIQGNKLQIGVIGPVSLQAWKIDTPIVEDQIVSVYYESKSGSGDAALWLLARSSGSGGTFKSYTLEIYPVTGNIRILGWLNGALVYNGGVASAPTGPGTYKLSVIGNSIKAYKDDILYSDKTNNAITGPGSAGIGVGASGGVSNAFIVDLFMGEDTLESIGKTQIGGWSEVFMNINQVGGKSEAFE